MEQSLINLPHIYIGPPGCSKTTTLLNMVDDELTLGTDPSRIAFLSFTRKATEEARDRACQRFNLDKRKFPFFRTIHSLCFNALGLSSSDVLEGDSLVEMGDWLGVEVSGKSAMYEGTMQGFQVGDRCLHLINTARVLELPLRRLYDERGEDLEWVVVDRVARGLEEYKRKKHLQDFQDMLEMFVAGSWRARLEALFVDEAADLSLLQWRVIDKLAHGVRRFVVAGDDDQAIFGFAGAATQHFISLPGQVTVLGQSWRVPAAPQALALGVIQGVRGRRPKAWAPRAGDAGTVARVGSLDEVDLGAGDDVLVLSRNSSFLREDAAALLRSSGILYSWHGRSSVRQEVVDAILDWERLRRGDSVPVQAAEAVYAQMREGVGYARGQRRLPYWRDRAAEVSLADLREHGGLLTDTIWHTALTRVTAEERAYMVRALRRGEKLRRTPTVRLSTVHGAKGGEAQHVVLLRDVAWRTFKETEVRPYDEMRVWYVAATRTKNRLTIVAPQTRRSYDI